MCKSRRINCNAREFFFLINCSNIGDDSFELIFFFYPRKAKKLDEIAREKSIIIIIFFFTLINITIGKIATIFNNAEQRLGITTVWKNIHQPIIVVENNLNEFRIKYISSLLTIYLKNFFNRHEQKGIIKTYPSATGAQFLDRHLVIPALAISFTSASVSEERK